MIAWRIFTRDDTEHGVEYVERREADEEIQRLDEEIDRLKDEIRNMSEEP
jgi:hypothetical protein